MQSSSRIPRRTSVEHDSVSSNTEVKNDKQEAAQKSEKLSLTDQGKAAKLLRQRLAFALAHNTKIKSDSSNSESDPETTGKGLKGQGERKSSIPRKISQENAKKPPQAQHMLGATNEGFNIPKGGERSRKFGAVQPILGNGVGNTQKENNSEANLSNQKKTAQISAFSSDVNNEMEANDNTALTLSRVPTSRDESLPIIHETATTKAEDVTSPNRDNPYDVVERELIKLKVEVDKNLVDFQGISAATENVKKKLQELRRDRIRSAS